MMGVARILTIALASAVILTGSAQAMNTGYLEVPDIKGESQRASNAAGGNQTQTIGANSTETIKGGQAVVIGAFWNGSDNPPKRNARGNVTLTLQRGTLSSSLLRLKNERRVIPSMKLVVDGKVGPKTTAYELKRVLVTSYSVNGSGLDGQTEEVEIAFHSVDW